MPAVALYARYSSDHQRDASIEDQLRICRERAAREGWSIADSYSDRSISGASLMRPGIQALMQDAQAGRFQVILAESLDRISRDQEDIAGVYKRLTFAGVRMVTLSEGDISELHIGLKGTMGALYLKDLADKTRRGLRGRVQEGKSGGGNSYGYRVVHRTGADGTPERGERAIDPAEAAVVRRIFTDYAAGKSPTRIAHELNAEGVLGPRGKAWGPSTLFGNASRGNGVLNNELYIGRLVWNRQRFLKDPMTGKRVARPNPPEQWVIQDVPELCIVDDALWTKVKERQTAIRARYVKDDGNALTARRRTRYLFSGLIKCGACGGGYSMVYRDLYGCATYKNKGTCTNALRVRRQELEARVLAAMRDKLMDPSLFRVFCEEFTRELNRLRMDASAGVAAKQAELEKVERGIHKIVEAIKEGYRTPGMKDELFALEDRKAKLTDDLAHAATPPALLHPNMAQEYRKRIDGLFTALQDERTRLEAGDHIRALVGRIVVSPNQDGGAALWLEGDLAGILSLASGTITPAASRDGRVLTSVVAGVGFEPTTFRL
ncbi:resolvase [Rhodovibrio sodomensis]|uniref:Resolvase n=1 Tax=Rhodovibrio sodomensis TaxID=1088 RepID=A0ABS1DPC2_9PROT|nr:recombinase family protein [Rhodovibrio sodomensis]MBK1671573.1 resolvase [Rhodovibrio sodomensis]